MDTKCRIGKVTFKNGTELHPFRGPLREVRNQTRFPTLDQANDFASAGRVQAILIAAVYDRGRVWTDYSVVPGTLTASVSEACAARQDFIQGRWRT